MGVKRLQPGEQLIAKRNGSTITLKIEEYLKITDFLSKPFSSKKDPLYIFENLLKKAVEREWNNGANGLMLSGGGDSRGIAHALLLQNLQFRSVTYGHWRSKDIRKGKGFADYSGIKHEVINYRNWSLKSYSSIITGLTGGTIGLQTSSNIVGFDRAQAFLKHGMTGFLGDSLTGQYLPRNKLGIRNIVFPALKKWNNLFHDIYQYELEYLFQILENKWKQYTGFSSMQRANLIDLTIRQATWTSAVFDVLEWFVELSYPFYDLNLISFLFWLPDDQKQGQRFYKKWLKYSVKRAIPQKGFTRSPSISIYSIFHGLLDIVNSYSGFFESYDVVNLENHIRRSFKWLSNIEKTIENQKLRRVFFSQIKLLENS